MSGQETLPPEGATNSQIRHLALPSVGEVLAERYEIQKLVARGGMACIFRGRHIGLDLIVAIKMLDPSILSETRSGAAVRFTREAQLASRLKHPSIVEIFDYGVTDAGLPYIVMEFLEGETLGQLLEREGPLPWPTVRRYMLQILGGLQVAHDAGMVHRDIKPENCFLVRDLDLVKVLDFGIAKVIHQAQRLTADGRVLGTPHYLSPEQAKAANIDERTDVYAIGIMMFEMLCGVCPFEDGSPIEIIAAHINAQPPPLHAKVDTSSMPSRLQALLDRVLAKDPEVRPRNARELADALVELDEEQARPPLALKRWAIVGAAAITLGIGVGAIAAAFSGDEDEPPVPLVAAEPEALEAEPAAPPRAVPEPEPQPEPQPEPEPEPEPVVVIEPEPEPAPTPSKAKAARRRPKKPMSVGSALRKAAAKCNGFAGPGGVRVGVRADIADDGTVGGVHIAPPYDETPLGSCVARALGRATLPSGSATQFSGSVRIGGEE